jgi:hypothetical protein
MDFFEEGKEFYLMTEYAASDRAICNNKSLFYNF